MKRFQFRNKIIGILLILMILFSAPGIGYASGTLSINLSLPAALHIYKPGAVVEIKGTATGLGEVGMTVRDPENVFVFAAQPKIVNGSFSASFTLKPDASEGKYTLSIGNSGLSEVKRNFIVSASNQAMIDIETPGTDMDFQPGEEIEIAGAALNVESFALCVRNGEGGRIFVSQPSVDAGGGTFSTKFRLPDDAISGRYSLDVNAFGFTNTVKNAFAVVVSEETGESGENEIPTEDTILTINGNGVQKKMFYTLEDLQEMPQIRAVFSVTSDLPEDLKVAAEGVSLEPLLSEAGIKSQAKMITFTGSDGYTAKFTVDELLHQEHYIFPGKKSTETIIALKRAERTSSYSKMTESEAPVLCFGQRAKTDQTLFSFVKKLQTITVTTNDPDQWSVPVAKITAPGSKTKTATTGGQVEGGSEIYLEGAVGGKIYYTTDGSTPDLDSAIFNPHGCGPDVGKYDPIEITKNTTVKAMVFGRGKDDSEVITYKFTVEGSIDTDLIVEIEESNIKREVVKLGNGRTEEKITLLAGIKGDIEKAEAGSCLMAYSSNDTDQVRIEISAGSLKKAQEKKMTLGLDSEAGRYVLPLSAIDFEKTAAELGVKSDSLTLSILISKAGIEDKTKLASKVGSGQQMMCDPVEFGVTITAPGGKNKILGNFGSAYVERSIPLSDGTDSGKAIGVVWNEAEEGFSPVPTRFETRNGENYAVLLSRTNSLYTVLQTDRAFTDIAGSWAKEDIESLASKLLISGRSETEYAPKNNVTRAEFAALLVRALGLPEGTLEEGKYLDISADAWYGGFVATAAREKIITGYDGGLFKPNETISRQEMAVMIGRAAEVAGKKAALTESEQTQLLAQLKDNTTVSSWSKQDVASAVKAGIIKGMPDQSFSPGACVDRAQSAAILKRFLIYVNFMDE